MKTSKIFIHDSTMVNAVSLMLFAGNELKIEVNSGMYTVSLEDGWLIFALRSLEVSTTGSVYDDHRYDDNSFVKEYLVYDTALATVIY